MLQHGGALKTTEKVKEGRHKRPHGVGLHLHEKSKTGKSTDMGSGG